MATERSQRVIAEPKSRPDSVSPLILVVDDDEGQRLTLADLLRHEGFEPVPCASAQAALRAAEARVFAAAILDLRLPDCGGLELLLDLRRRQPELPVIIHTGYGSFDSAKQALNRGVSAYVEKVEDPAELLRHVHRAVQAGMRAALHANELRQALLLAQVPALLWTTDTALCLTSAIGRPVDAAPESVPPLGTSLEEVLRDRSDRQTVIAGHQRALRGEPNSYEYEYAGRLYSTRVQPLRDAAGRIVGVIGVAVDVTVRRQAETALRQSEERFRQLAENIHEAFYLIDVARRECIYVSPAFAAIWRGAAQAPPTLAEWGASVHPEDRPRFDDALTRRLAGDALDLEYRIIWPDGVVRTIHDRAFPVRNAAGEAYRVAGVAEDITARRRLEEQLGIAQRMEAVGQLAGGVAHDFNNILTAILGYSELVLAELERDLAPGAAAIDGVRQIERSARRAASLTRQLLVFSRRQPMRFTVLDPNRVLDDVAGMLRRLIGEQYRLELEKDPDAWPIRADAAQLEQVIVNIVINARDAMPDGGVITVRTSNAMADRDLPAGPAEAPSGAYGVISISDTGVGMTADVLERIFEPFFTTKPVGRGTGLGLAMAHGVVKQTGGHIEVDSSAARGSCFRVFLPAAPGEAPTNAAAPPAPPTQGRGELILLCEDDRVVRQLTGATLERAGYQVVSVENGAAALAAAGQIPGQIHLLLSDVIMPELSGPKLAELLQRDRPDMAALFMSGYTAEALAAQGLREHDIELLEKPFRNLDLLERVRSILDRGASAAAR